MFFQQILKYLITIILLLCGVGCASTGAAPVNPTPMPLLETDTIPASTPALTIEPVFKGSRALADIEKQLSFGPRTPGSVGHYQITEWIVDEIEELQGWEVERQDSYLMGHPIQNIIAKLETGRGGDSPLIIIGAHYDTRFNADQDSDPTKRIEPVPGANDGASGVAVLLELARTLPLELPQDVWLVFFDAEDNGGIKDWDWILGSRAFVELMSEPLKTRTQAVVILDMIGDADLNIHYEINSNQEISKNIWGIAEVLGYQDIFIPEGKFRMLDDHTPFLQAGIPAVDIIDFDYPYWHTTEDTLDKVSAQSLQIVGDVIFAWVTQP